MKYLIFLFPLILSSQSQARCLNTRYKYTDNNTEKRIPINICKGKEWKTSPSCQNLNCELYKNATKMGQSGNNVNNHGNPGFALCHNIGGRPIVGEYFSRNLGEWFKTSLCFDKNFKEFLPISLLIRMASGHSGEQKSSQKVKERIRPNRAQENTAQ